MTWSRLEDDMDENRKLRRLSADAFRLYWIAVSWCRRHQTGGRLYLDDVEELCAKHRIRKPKTTVDDLLVVPYDFETGCWSEVEPGLYEVHDFEEYNPPTSTERVRKHRSTQRERNGGETLQGVSGNGPSRARLRAGYPDPVPEPVPTASNEAFTPPDPPRGHDEKAEAGTRLVRGVHEAVGRQLSADDNERVHSWLYEFNRLSETEILAEVREAVANGASNGKPIQTVRYFEPRLRDRQDRKVDTRLQNQSRQSSGMARVGDIL